MIFYTGNEVLSMAFNSCLSTGSYLVFKDFPIEFYAELKNDIFVQGHHI